MKPLSLFFFSHFFKFTSVFPIFFSSRGQMVSRFQMDLSMENDEHRDSPNARPR